MRKLFYLLAILACFNISFAGVVGCGPPGEPEEAPVDYDPTEEEEGYGDELDEMGDEETEEEDEY